MTISGTVTKGSVGRSVLRTPLHHVLENSETYSRTQENAEMQDSVGVQMKTSGQLDFPLTDSFNEKIFYVIKKIFISSQSCQNWILEIVFPSCECSHMNYET